MRAVLKKANKTKNCYKELETLLELLLGATPEVLVT
jgi:hypothetical protein